MLIIMWVYWESKVWEYIEEGGGLLLLIEEGLLMLLGEESCCKDGLLFCILNFLMCSYCMI